MRNPTWKRNRNAYAHLLLSQLDAGELSEPFIKVPDSQPLPTLPQYLRHLVPPKSPTFRCTHSPRRRRRPSDVHSSAVKSRSRSFDSERRSPRTPEASGRFSPDPRGSSEQRRHNQPLALSRSKKSTKYDLSPQAGYANSTARLAQSRANQASQGQLEAVVEQLEEQLQAAQRQLVTQQHQIAALEAELGAERATRANEKKRLRQLHMAEIEELRRIHLDEIEALGRGPKRSNLDPRRESSKGSRAHSRGDLEAFNELPSFDQARLARGQKPWRGPQGTGATRARERGYCSESEESESEIDFSAIDELSPSFRSGLRDSSLGSSNQVADLRQLEAYPGERDPGNGDQAHGGEFLQYLDEFQQRAREMIAASSRGHKK